MDLKQILSFAFYGLLIMAILAVLFVTASAILSVTVRSEVTVFMDHPVSGASVSIYALNDDGTRGSMLAGPIETDETGTAKPEFTKSSSYILVESSGGLYSETSSPAPVRLLRADVMRAVVPAGTDWLTLTPFSDMAASLASSSMKKGATPSSAVAMANAAVSRQYHVFNVTGTLPVQADDAQAVAGAAHGQREYGVLLAGLVQSARRLDARPIDLMRALSADWSDGVLDGAENGQPISLPTSDGSGSIELPAAAGSDGLQASIDAFISSDSNAANLVQFSISRAPVCANSGFYIETTTLPAWRDGEYGWSALSVGGASQRGGSPNATWRLKAGSVLPAGFELNEDGIISGTGSLQPGSVESISPPFIVVASDASNPSRTCEAELRLTISEQPPVFKPNIVTCTVGTDCTQSLLSFVSGGTPPYHFESFAPDKGDYPAGLMVWADGTLRGKSTYSGEFAIQVCVIDLVGWADCQDVIVNVKGKPQTVQPSKPASNGGSSSRTCEPGHYATTCGGQARCCLNGWVCCGGSCKPPSMCGLG